MKDPPNKNDDSNFITLYKSIYTKKISKITNRMTLMTGLSLLGVGVFGWLKDQLSTLGLIQGLIAGFLFSWTHRYIISQQLKHPKVARPSLHITSQRTKSELGSFLYETFLYSISGITFFFATSGLFHPEHFWPVVPLPEDEGYPRLARNFVMGAIYVLFLAALRSFWIIYYQKKFVMFKSTSSNSKVEILMTLPRILVQSLILVGSSLIMSTFISDYSYDFMYGAWLFFQHILYSRSVELSNSFLGYLALTGIFLNVFWMVTDELVSSSLVEHLDREVVVNAGVRTLLSGLEDSNGNDDYIRVFCASELLHHSKSNSTFRQEIYGRLANPSSNLPAQPIWPFVCKSLLDILNQFSLRVKDLTSEVPLSNLKLNESKSFHGVIPISNLLDKVYGFIFENVPSFWSHANEDQLHLTQFWAHISLALMHLINFASTEDQCGIVQWDIQEVMKSLLELHNSLDLFLDEINMKYGLRDHLSSSSSPDMEDAKYLINSVTMSCMEIVSTYEDYPGRESYLPQKYIDRIEELKMY